MTYGAWGIVWGDAWGWAWGPLHEVEDEPHGAGHWPALMRATADRERQRREEESLLMVAMI